MNNKNNNRQKEYTRGSHRLPTEDYICLQNSLLGSIKKVNLWFGQ